MFFLSQNSLHGKTISQQQTKGLTNDRKGQTEERGGKRHLVTLLMRRSLHVVSKTKRVTKQYGGENQWVAHHVCIEQLFLFPVLQPWLFYSLHLTY